MIGTPTISGTGPTAPESGTQIRVLTIFRKSSIAELTRRRNDFDRLACGGPVSARIVRKRLK
jgi:hypothetical protein